MKYSLEFLAWVDRTLFRDDFKKELEELGIEFDIIFGLLSSQLWRKQGGARIIDLYQNCISWPAALESIEKYLQSRQEIYDKILLRIKNK